MLTIRSSKEIRIASLKSQSVTTIRLVTPLLSSKLVTKSIEIFFQICSRSRSSLKSPYLSFLQSFVFLQISQFCMYLFRQNNMPSQKYKQERIQNMFPLFRCSAISKQCTLLIIQLRSSSKYSIYFCSQQRRWLCGLIEYLANKTFSPNCGGNFLASNFNTFIAS